ncbi:MAG: hypothetical protein ACRC6G_09505, partial [Deefgea sp.]
VEIAVEVKAAKPKRAVKAKAAPDAIAEIVATESVEDAKPKRSRKVAAPAASVDSEADTAPAKPKRVRKTSQE